MGDAAAFDPPVPYSTKASHDQLVLDSLKSMQRSIEGLHSYIQQVENRVLELRERFNRYYPEHRNCNKCGRIIPTLKSRCKFCGSDQSDVA